MAEEEQEEDKNKRIRPRERARDQKFEELAEILYRCNLTKNWQIRFSCRVKSETGILCISKKIPYSRRKSFVGETSHSVEESLILSQKDVGVVVDSPSTIQKNFHHLSDRMIVIKFGSSCNMSSIGNSPVRLRKNLKTFYSIKDYTGPPLIRRISN